MTTTLLIALAGLMGAAGIMLAAAGAHAAPGAGLDGAAYMLLFVFIHLIHSRRWPCPAYISQLNSFIL
jgi:hypothetical protein